MRVFESRWTKGMILLLICFSSSIVSCRSVPASKPQEVKASAKGCGQPFVKEHDDLFAENIRLKAALKFCKMSIEQNR